MRLAALWSITSFGLLGVAGWTSASAVAGDRVVAAVEGWGGLSSGILAVLYALRARGWPVEGWFGQSGVLGVGLGVLLGPYQILAGAILFLMSRLGREPGADEVASGLFVGRRPFVTERGELARQRIVAVLGLCAELPSRLNRGGHAIATLRCPVLDGTPPTPAQFAQGVSWVEQQLAEGRGVLIHCAQGHGRSAIVAAVVLVQTGRAPHLDAALTQIQRAHPGARPSRDQRRAAAKFLEHGGSRSQCG